MPNQENALTPAPMNAVVPAFIADADASKGNENVTAQDLLLPTIKLLQALSPMVQEDNADYIEGARPGLMVNTLTADLYTDMFVIPVHFITEWTVFIKREMRGDGPVKFGSYATEEDAMAALVDKGEDPSRYNIVKTARHTVFVLDEAGNKVTEALIFMDSTKLQTSNKWNSQIRLTGRPRYAGIWKLTSRRQSNNQGSWYNFDIAWFGYVASEELYRSAESLCEDMSQGTIRVDADE